MHELITIPFSHYCEKARWALDLEGVSYRERRYLPGLHVRPARRAAKGRGRADAHSSAASTPILVMDGEPICGSSAIVRRVAPALFAGDEVEALVRDFDDALGPHTRRIAYWFVLGRAALFQQLADENVSRGQALAARLTLPLLGRALRRRLGVDRPGFERSMVRVTRVADDVAARLEDGRPYLTGDAFTAADLTFAALFAPVILPGPDRYGARLPPLERFCDEGRRTITTFRDHPAGRFAARVYEAHRVRGPRR